MEAKPSSSFSTLRSTADRFLVPDLEKRKKIPKEKKKMASSKLFVILIYTTLALFLLILLSSNNKSHSHHNYRHRRLKLRPAISNYTSAPPHSPIPFDPVISDLQLHRDDRLWEKSHFHFNESDHAPGHVAQPEWEDFMDAEDYINDDDRFNVTSRIESLFPSIDVGPPDGLVSAAELAEWNVHQARREVLHRTRREMELHDKNKDGFVSFKEYEPPNWASKSHGDGDSVGGGWWSEEHFNASDVDGDGLLNLTEFNDFQHPADSSNPKLIQWLCKEEIRERDTDKDGKLNFQEFFHGLFDSLRNYDEVRNESDTSETAAAKKLFQELDQDNNRFLSDDELHPVIGTIHPGEYYYAKQQADYVLSQADADKDGQLTLKEMIEHPYVFYSAIFSEDDYEDIFHDEFR